MYLSHGCPTPLQHFLLARAEDLVEESILLDRVVKENTSTRMKKKKKRATYIPLFQSSRGSMRCGSRDLGSGPEFSVVYSESVFTELSPFIHICQALCQNGRRSKYNQHSCCHFGAFARTVVTEDT